MTMEEVEERFVKSYPQFCCNGKPLSPFWDLWQAGAEFGYQKAKEDVKHDLMMKLKDEGIVKLLKVSILRNERLSSQEQQELCAWIECAMDFGENLDECAKELEEANKANEWHYVKDGLPKELHDVICFVIHNERRYVLQGYLRDGRWVLSPLGSYLNNEDVIAWKEIVLPELPKESV